MCARGFAVVGVVSFCNQTLLPWLLAWLLAWLAWFSCVEAGRVGEGEKTGGQPFGL